MGELEFFDLAGGSMSAGRMFTMADYARWVRHARAGKPYGAGLG